MPDVKGMFRTQLERAVAQGVAGAALVDRDGNTIGLAGEMTYETAKPLATLVLYRLKSADLAKRLFAGEVVSLDLDGREIAVGIARRQLFVVATIATPDQLALVAELRDDVATALAPDDPRAPHLWRPGGGGSGSGPAALPLIERGVTVPRRLPN